LPEKTASSDLHYRLSEHKKKVNEDIEVRTTAAPHLLGARETHTALITRSAEQVLMHAPLQDFLNHRFAVFEEIRDSNPIKRLI
jgi:gamma-glutamylcysteine synthetase